MEVSFLPQPDLQNMVAQLVQRFQYNMQQAGKPYQPSQHDDVHVLAEATAYLLALQHTKIERSISQSFLSFAEGKALDHLGQTFYGVQRLTGVKPTAEASFTLTQLLDYPLTIHKDQLRLGNEQGDTALLLEDLQFKVDPTTGKTAGSQTATIVLQKAVAQSNAQTNEILTPQPFLQSLNQLGSFDNGQDAETDSEYKKRLVQSLFKTSTAGSLEAYQYLAKSAANRVHKVTAYSTAAGKVRLRYYATVMDDAMQKRLEDALLNSKVRPIGEELTIQKATIKNIDFTAKVAFEGLVNTARIEEVIRKKFAEYADFDRTIYKTAFCLWVEDDSNLINLEVTSPTEDVTLKQGEYPVLRSLRLIEAPA